MKLAAFFAAARVLPFASLGDLLGTGGALIVAPHPDDESLGCGSLIAAATEAGRSARIVVVSDGAGSHPNSKAYPSEKLRALREAEALEAAAALGLRSDAVSFLRLPDRFVPTAGAAAECAVESIAAAAGAVGASALFVTWRLDPHCDHRAAYALTRAAQRRLDGVRLFEYAIWAERLPLDEEPQGPPRGFRFDARRYFTRKRAAVDRHRSQVSRLIEDNPEGVMLDPAMVCELVARDEVYLEMAP